MSYIKNMNKGTKSKILVIIPLLFIVLTLFYSLKRVPFFDEAHGFLISQLKTIPFEIN